MSAPWIKPNSFRSALLLALADGAITTIDDLQTRMDEPRKKIQDNIQHAFKEGLLNRLRDDVTGGPAYQITSLGRKHLAAAAEKQPQEAEPTPVPAPKIEAIADWDNRCEEQPAEEIACGAPKTESARIGVEVAAAPTHEPIEPPVPCRYISDRYVTDADWLVHYASLDEAQKDALSIARNGLRTAVYKLVPVGTAVPAPGAEWAAA